MEGTDLSMEQKMEDTDHPPDVGQLQDEREEIQKKTFSIWINNYLDRSQEQRRITDLFYDLRDGQLLLCLLEVLTEAPVSIERGSLRVHYLANTAAVLGILQRQRVRITGINNMDLVDGNPKMTLSLVWAVILHWQFHKVLSSLSPSLAHTNQEKILLAWVRQSLLSSPLPDSPPVRNFTTDWTDGRALCGLLLAHHPGLVAVEGVMEKELIARMELIFRLAESNFEIPCLLDPQDLANNLVDKKCMITYVMCLFECLPHDDLTEENVLDVSLASDPGFSVVTTHGSPAKTPVKALVRGCKLGLSDWANILEEVLSWLLEAEDHLVSDNSLGQKQLEVVKTRFYNHEDFMMELKTHQGAVGEVLQEGQRLLETNLSIDDRDDVRLQMKVLNERWEKVRNLAMGRQAELHNLIMVRQEEQVGRLRSWMTTAEDRISRMGDLSQLGKQELTATEELEKQLEDQQGLQRDLENQQGAVTNLSNFILVDGEDCSDLEDQLAALGERWCMLCRWCEERCCLLKEMDSIFHRLDTETSLLGEWLSEAEINLRMMELTTSVDTQQLLDQVKQVLVIQGEVDIEEKRLNSITVYGQRLQEILGMENSVQAKMNNDIETLQDRWDILIEILEAQKQRISSLGIEFKSVAKTELDKLGRAKKERQDSLEDLISAKKRKVTGTKRITFETAYARISTWLEHIASRLDVSHSGAVAGLSLEDQQFLYEETEAEIREQRGKVQELVSIGQDLVKDIESEEDFPRDYLANVTEKINFAKSEEITIQSLLGQLKDRIDYQVEKSIFYELLSELDKILVGYNNFLASLDAVAQDRCSLESSLESCKAKRKLLMKTEDKLEQLRKIAGQLALHNGAFNDPSNTVKQDSYSLCDKFETVESQICKATTRLLGLLDKLESDPSITTNADIAAEPVVIQPELGVELLEYDKDGDKADSDKINCDNEPEDTTSDSAPTTAVLDLSEHSEILTEQNVTYSETNTTAVQSDLKTISTSEIGNIPLDTDPSEYSLGRTAPDTISDQTVDRSTSDPTPDTDPIVDSDQIPDTDPIVDSDPTPDTDQIGDSDPTADTIDDPTVDSSVEKCSPMQTSTDKNTEMSSNITSPVEHDKEGRELSELEINVRKSKEIVNANFYIDDENVMDDELTSVRNLISLLGDVFVPASLTDDEAQVLLDDWQDVKQKLHEHRERLSQGVETLRQYREEIEGLTLWMKEVETFLHAEDAACGDLETLEAQLKESNALQDDIETLHPNVDNINETGISLLERCRPDSEFCERLEEELRTVNQAWEHTICVAKAQNEKLGSAYVKSRQVQELMSEINTFLDHLENELPPDKPVAQAPELSQRTYKLLQLRDKTERKSSVLQRLSAVVGDLMGEGQSQEKGEGLGKELEKVQNRWSALTEPVQQQYIRLREASSDYGEFKTLAAQESDWLDRLEKKLRRSSKSAADAEEICEELDDIENCLHNHPTERIDRLTQLSNSLTMNNIIISPVQTDAMKLAKRWETLSKHARERTRVLEGCIAEAQEWECKILAVQDWLAEKDMLLTSHLEHELTVDDLPDETQRMLREFEDQENQLSDMDLQVDSYRKAGKEEAAARLEDQLHLIHARFQELASKFELFQRPSDYDGRLARISRQLRDIQHNMYLTELVSHEAESIQGQLHHARCIYNALADIKPEVEGTIKMGRKLVDTKALPDPEATNRNIDSLKSQFNQLGAQVTDARTNLEKALAVSESLATRLGVVMAWLDCTSANINTHTPNSKDSLLEKLNEMKLMKKNIREILNSKMEFTALCSDPSLLGGLREALFSLESKWSSVQDQLVAQLEAAKSSGQSVEFDLADLALTVDEGERLMSPGTVSSVSSSVGEEGKVLTEFRTAFQEIASWLDGAEGRLERERRASQDRVMGQELMDLKPKVENLGAMALRIVERFTGQRPDVEPEMAILGQRWETVARRLEERLASSEGFSLVEVEKICTTISHLAIPLSKVTDVVVDMSEPSTSVAIKALDDEDSIMTLPEDSEIQMSPLKRGLPRETGSAKRPLLAQTLDSSRESSPEREVITTMTATATVTLSNNSLVVTSPATSKIPLPIKVPPKVLQKLKSPTKEVKTPPRTLPKPRWYVESLHEKQSSPDTSIEQEPLSSVQEELPKPVPVGPVKQVTITATTLPSVTSTNFPPSTLIQPQVTQTPSPIKSPERTVLPPTDSPASSPVPMSESTSSSCLLIPGPAPIIEGPKSLLEDIDRQNEKEFSMIERLLRGTSADIEDVKARKASGGRFTISRESSLNHARDVRDFEDTSVALAGKMSLARERLVELETETDLQLRTDLIDMETQQLEAEVATTISRGDTLVLMIHRHDTDQAKSLQDKISQLRDTWTVLKQFAERKKADATKADKDLVLFKKKVDKLKLWFVKVGKMASEAKGKENENKMAAVRVEVEKKSSDIKDVNDLATRLSDQNALAGQGIALAMVNSKWEEILSVTSPPRKVPRKSKSQSPRPVLDKSVPAEIFNRITKMREALAAVEKHLHTTILNGKKFENLALQAEQLERVNNALDTLRPKVRQTEKDVELMSGSLSMEYFEKLTALGEKFRQEWRQVNEDYVKRLSCWKDCNSKVTTFNDSSDSLESWMTAAEATIAAWKQGKNENTIGPEKVKLEAELASAHKKVTHLSVLGKEIEGGCGSSEGRDVRARGERIIKRWKFILSEVKVSRLRSESIVDENGEGDVKHEREKGEVRNINLVMSWADDSLKLGQSTNVSELWEMTKTVEQIQMTQMALTKQRQVLDELSVQVGNNSAAFRDAKAKVEKVGQVLPKRLSYLMEKSEKLAKMVEGIEEGQKWVDDMASRHEELEKVNSPREQQLRIRLAVSDKEYSINQLLNDYLLLEREVTSSSNIVNPQLASDIKSLKEKWLELTASVRKVIPATWSQSVTIETKEESSVSNSTQPVSPSHSNVMSDSPPASSMNSLGSPTTPSTSEQFIASPTTVSTSPLWDEVAPNLPLQQVNQKNDMAQQLGNKTGKVMDWLAGLGRESLRVTVNVAATDSVGKEVDRHRDLLQQLESRRPQIEELLAAAADGQQLETHQQMRRLQEEWDSTHQCLLSRKTELTAMFEHSDNAGSKAAEVSKWLGKLERQLASDPSVGKTRDVLLGQIREVNGMSRELTKYSHHITLFSQMCQRLVSIYSRDDTSGISSRGDEVNGRYSGLSSSCLARGKALQTALTSLNQFDSDLASFIAWLGEVEASLERLETDVEGGAEGSNRLSEIQEEVRSHDAEFRSLSIRCAEQLAAAPDTDIVLVGRTAELGRRWTALQNTVLGLADKIEGAGSKGAEQMVEWAEKKLEELAQLRIGGSVAEISKQIEEHSGFRDQIEERRSSVEACLKEKWREEMGSLAESWDQLLSQSESWTVELDTALQKARRVEDQLADLYQRMKGVEDSVEEWEECLSYDMVQSEMAVLESTVSDLHKLEELVMEVKVGTDQVNVSAAVAQQLSALERRLTEVQEKASARREFLSGLAVQPNPGNQQFLQAALPSGWDRMLTNDDVPYFSSHQTETTQWDHPEFVSLVDSLAAINTVKFCAYRLSLKLRKIQQRLCLDLLDIASAVVCFDSHGITADKHDLTIAVPEMVTVLTSVYEMLYQCEPEDIEVPLCVDLALNWLLNVYDSQRLGYIRVLSFKLGLVVLCRGPLTEKYSVMFKMAAGQMDTTLDQRRLGLLLYDLVQVPRCLGEIAQFGGSNIEPSVRSCFQLGTKEPRSTIDEETFQSWLTEEPQSMVWLPVLHRLASAETARHDVRCRICKMSPIVGFRYHCRRCFNLDICHNCFFLGRTVSGHKPEHPMQEYCTSTTKTDNAKHLLQAFRNSFRSRKYFKRKQKKLGYLPVQSVLEGESFESPTLSPNLSFESRDLQSSTAGSLTPVHKWRKGSFSERSNSVSKTEDEHHLIAAYCRLLTSGNNNNNVTTASILQDVDCMQKETVEQMLAELREENGRLENELKELKTLENKAEETNATSVEAKNLRQQKQRLEARMTILEDHNRQLEAQLERLRQLVTDSGTGTLQSRYVVAAQLHSEGQEQPQGPESRPPPPSKETLSVRQSLAESSCSDRARDSGTSESLNLSQHNTESQED